MKLTQLERLSILACITGLALLTVFFAGFGLGAAIPDWLPMAIAGIAGFELLLAADALRRRWRGGGLNG